MTFITVQNVNKTVYKYIHQFHFFLVYQGNPQNPRQGEIMGK